MASVSTYLNFDGNTEEAFTFYKRVFGTEFVGEIARMGDVPMGPEGSNPSEQDANLVVNVTLPITGGHLLQGTDTTESMGFTLNQGNNVYICLDPDSREEADCLFGALSEGGTVQMEMADMFWGDYFGSLVDTFGVQWMINYSGKG
jgi:PhnB protein